MKLALAAAHQILVELSAEEQLRFGLSAERTQNGDLRETLRQILAGVASASGRRFHLLQQVRVDLLPDRVGGCLLIISGLEEQPAETGRSCFIARTENELIDAARAAVGAGDDLLITLLKSETGYYLLTPLLPDRLVRLLSEFMRYTALEKTAEAVLLERCAVLLRDQPLSALGGGA